MADFSFTLTYQGVKTWIWGQVVKEREPLCYAGLDEPPAEQEYREVFRATSERFPGYEATARHMNLAVNAYRDGLKQWLDDHPDQVPKREKIGDG